ncbi:MAG: Bax inhibitor-1/YccA family protein [Opitutaceae bacterium]|nr:Bax inhibitor-1/YccA family protein [Cytophagales bacterium]
MDITRSYKKEIAPESRAFLNDVFSWMGLGLALTAVVSYFVATTPSIMEMFFTETGPSMLGYIVTFAPIGFVLVMSFAFQKLSYGTLVLLFALYAGLMGLSLSFIFMVYTSESIYSTFGISAGMFGAMGLIGYLTKTDLTKMGNILLMALIGVIIAGVVNMFMHSSVMGYIISFVSVLIFCGLTAYDVQKIKNLSEDHSIDSYNKSKLGIMGALTLYLDFINLFLAMLRLFGNRK